ncbi:MAG: B12-binding domain-containing radical SAM protein [Deltaproteobacteria bacterium]|nr:B12-binding domain-containing radical SAM protein [Deltaproteobacteria bacterium]
MELKLRLLFINPPFTHTLRFPGNNRTQLSECDYSPPIGMMYVMSYVKQQMDAEIRFFNFQIPNTPSFQDFEDLLRDFQPDVIGITVNTFVWWSVYNLLSEIRKILPSALIVGGGPHMWILPEETLKNSEFDVIVQGEGEKTFVELLTRFQTGSGFEGIAGILYKDNGEIKKNIPRIIEQNPDVFPFPDRTGFDINQYRHPGNKFAATAIIFTGRGCPHLCTFCNNKDRSYRMRTATHVVDEILKCKAMGYKSIDFADSNFNNSIKHVKEICKELIRRNVKTPWTCNARLDNIDYELLALMAEAGCERICFGVESANQEILNRVKKNIDINRVHDVFAWSRSLNITTVGLFIIGFPGETVSQVKTTMDLAIQIKADYIICQVLMPIYGTDIFKEAETDSNFDSDFFRRFICNPQPDLTIPIWSTGIPTGDLIRLLRLFYLIFYLRPNYILRTLQRLSGYEDTKTKIKMALRLLLKFK